MRDHSKGSEMIVVMQCAKTKRAEAGHMRMLDGRVVGFVAQPEFAPGVSPELPSVMQSLGSSGVSPEPSSKLSPNPPVTVATVYARPDDLADTGRTWREELMLYNRQHNPDVTDIPLEQHIRGSKAFKPATQQPASQQQDTQLPTSQHNDDTNPLGLLPAWQLYKNKTYALLADTFGTQNLYIFSAGWGLVRSDFLLPKYDITLSPAATGPDKYKRRRKDDPYDDFAMLPSDAAGPVVFLGSKAYVPLFCQLTDGTSAHRIIFHNSKVPPEAPNCEIRKHDIAKKTDWHYDAAQALATGKIAV